MTPNLQAKLYRAFDIDPAPVRGFMAWLADDYALASRADGALRVLDIGCGPGRMLPEYAALGWHVVGMEPDDDYYEQAWDFTQGHADVSVKQGAFGDINEEAAYDLIAAVNDPFAYLLAASERADALARAYRALRPGGVLFLDVPNFPFILFHYQKPFPTISMVDGDLVTRSMAHTIDFHNAIWTHDDTFSVPGRVLATKRHRLAILTPPELVNALGLAGFVGVATYNSYAARGHEPLDGARILLSARKALPNTATTDATTGEPGS